MCADSLCIASLPLLFESHLVLFGSLCFTSSKWTIKKRRTFFVEWKVKVQLMRIQEPDSWKKCRSDCNNFDDQAKSDRPKTADFEAVVQTIEANPGSSTRRVSGELGRWLITFTTSVETSGDVDLYFTL